ncbi:MAG: alpha-amylase [Chitinophagales bacterium]|nr:alpha-amylase [Chitinophagales bacterium]
MNNKKNNKPARKSDQSLPLFNPENKSDAIVTNNEITRPADKKEKVDNLEEKSASFIPGKKYLQTGGIRTENQGEGAIKKVENNSGTAVCIYFQVHQPFRLREYSFTHIGNDHFYENYEQNIAILNQVSEKCYLPANKKFLELLSLYKGKFKLTYSFSGVVLEQLQLYRPDVLESFQALVASGYVEILEETYYHSLSYIFSKNEFDRQVQMHHDKVKELFSAEPTIFRNTELIFNNDIADHIAGLGYRGMLCEGADKWLNGRSPNQVFAVPGKENFGLLLKNYRLSDDIAFRFSNSGWEHWPLTAEKFTNWIHKHAGAAETINLFMDYETFGEHQWKETGIFNFISNLPPLILKHPDFHFRTASEVLELYPVRDIYDVPDYTSWADADRDISAWNENEMQKEAFNRIYALENAVKQTQDADLLKVWGKLQTSDHFYYMSTKFWSDGDVHKYFSPFNSPYDAAIYYMNILSDLEKILTQ